MKNILITGASGFIGSHLAEAAKHGGYQVFSLARKTSNTQWLQENNIQIVEGDITKPETLLHSFAALKDRGVQLDYVVHCAGLTKGRNLEAFMATNYDGTVHLIDAVKASHPRIKKIIFLSSLAASGPKTLNDVIRLDDQQPITNYGKSKLAAETLIKNAGLPYLILRPTAVYGPREKDIFTIFKLLKKGINPVIGSHKQQLTFVFVKDLVKIIMLGLSNEKKNATFFVSDGNVYDKLHLAQFIGKSLNQKTKQITLPLWSVKGMAFLSQTYYGLQNKWSPLNLEKFQELKAQSWVCEVENTFQAFDYVPKYNLENGVMETTDWYRNEKWL